MCFDFAYSLVFFFFFLFGDLVLLCFLDFESFVVVLIFCLLFEKELKAGCGEK